MNTKFGEQYPVAKKKKKKKRKWTKSYFYHKCSYYLSNQKYNKILKNDWLSPTQFELP